MSDMLSPAKSPPNLERLEDQVLLLQRQCQTLHQENLSLSTQLEDAKQTLDAIQNGQIDALVVNTPAGPRIYSLQGADRPYRILIEQMQEGAVTLAQDGTIQFCNRALANLLKRPLETLMGSSMAAYVDALDRPAFVTMLRRSIHDPSHGEVVLRAIDGSAIPVLLGLTRVQENGQTSICVVLTDLTERRRTDEVLAKEQFIRRLIENAPIGVAVVDPKLHYILANPAYQALADHPILIGRSIADGFAQAVTQIVQPLVQQVLKSGQALEAKDYAIPVEGKRWWNISILPLLDDAGNTEAVLLLTQDITQRKLAQESQTLLSAIVESSGDAIISKSIDGIILSWNAAAERMFGYSPDEIIGQSVTKLMPPERVQEEEKILARLRAAERIEHLETVRIAKDGHRIDVSITISPMKDSAGHVYGASKIVHDITERKRTEQALKDAMAAAELSNKSKDHFLAVLSHELRTPLSPVLTMAQMMESDAALAIEHRETFAMIRRNVELEIRLIDDLLDQTRISQGKLMLHKTTVDLYEVQQSVNQICEGELKAKNLKLHVLSEAREHHVNGDAGRLQQILWNLLKNAVKFTPAGGRIEIRTTTPTPQRVTISVSDSGIGIDPALLPRIFQCF